MTPRFRAFYAELLITTACNLHCDGCGNYTNYGMKGFMDADETAAAMKAWSARVAFENFRILGGEPMIHPELGRFVAAAAECWPEAKRWVVTNGLLLARRAELIETMVATGTRLLISFHSDDPRYLERMRPALAEAKRWSAAGVAVRIEDYRAFVRMYRGIGRNMRPFADGNPSGSWTGCLARRCINLKAGRLWKCPQTAYLAEVLAHFALTENPEWAPYLGYKGIGLEASDAELGEFLQRGPEACCGMCPVEKPRYRKDVFNLDFDRPEERLETEFAPVDLKALVKAL